MSNALIVVDCIENCTVQTRTILRCSTRHPNFVRGQREFRKNVDLDRAMCESGPAVDDPR